MHHRLSFLVFPSSTKAYLLFSMTKSCLSFLYYGLVKCTIFHRSKKTSWVYSASKLWLKIRKKQQFRETSHTDCFRLNKGYTRIKVFWNIFEQSPLYYYLLYETKIDRRRKGSVCFCSVFRSVHASTILFSSCHSE